MHPNFPEPARRQTFSLQLPTQEVKFQLSTIFRPRKHEVSDNGASVRKSIVPCGTYSRTSSQDLPLSLSLSLFYFLFIFLSTSLLSLLHSLYSSFFLFVVLFKVMLNECKHAWSTDQALLLFLCGSYFTFKMF